MEQPTIASESFEEFVSWVARGDEARKLAILRDNVLPQALWEFQAQVQSSIPFEIEGLVARLPVTRRTLERRFRKLLSTTIHQTFTQYRSRKARQLLDVTSLTLTEVALRAGFSDLSQMNREFQRVLGMSPGQYRKQSSGSRGNTSPQSSGANRAQSKIVANRQDGRFGAEYTGATTVSQGTLLINGSLTGAGGAVTVASGGTLGGSGVISRAVNIQAGGTLAPGNSPDQIFTGALTLAALSIYEIELLGPTIGNGVTGYDQTVVTGAVSLGGALLSLLTISGVSVGDTFTIIDNDGADAVTGTFAGLAEGAEFVEGGYYFSISYLGGVNNNDVVLQITAIVPEPASLTLCGLALLVGGGVTWRKHGRRRLQATLPEPQTAV